MEEMKMNLRLQKLIESGIPISKAVFQSAVNNGRGEPETNFSSASTHIGRQVEMWLTPIGLICYHSTKYFGTPLANIVSFEFKP